MKITGIETQVWRSRESKGEVHPAWAPGTSWSTRRTTIFVVNTDEGLSGIGSGVGSPEFVANMIAPRLVGQDPFLFEKHTDTLRNTGGPWLGHPIVWGIEMALWDLLGNATGQPLWKLWGGATNRVRAYASMIELRSPEQRAEDALKCLELGYRAIKLRIHSWTMKEDIAQVEAVRKAVGDRMEIMVDANQAQTPGTPRNADGPVWTFERAVATCPELERLGVRWLEEPMPRFAFDDLSRLTEASNVPIAGGENNVGLHEFRLLIDRNCYDIIQADAVCSEGMFQLRKVAAYAEMHNKLFVPHHGGSAIGIAAHMSLSGGCPNSPYVELLQDLPVLSAADFQGLIAPPYFEPDSEGYVYLTDKPSLGVQLGEAWERVV
jgi:L-alanine-DL-glutamate epimerase-like enolase superfamily enzyme